LREIIETEGVRRAYLLENIARGTLRWAVFRSHRKSRLFSMALSRKSKIIVGIVVGALVITGVVVSIVRSRGDVAEVITVKLERRRELKSSVTASGEIRPIQFINLTSEVQGRIEEIYVKEGDPVKKGTPLVKLDPTALNSSTDAQLAAMQASLNDVQVSRSQIIAAQNQLLSAQQSLNAAAVAVDNARQQVTSAEIDVNTAKRELRRTTELVEAGVESKAAFDAAKDRFDLSEIRFRSAELAVRESESRLKQQEVSVKDGRRAVETAELSSKTSSKRAEQQQALLQGQKTQRDKTLSVAPINGVIADIP
jgi:HlyD family secretion protein